jgi:hypothetical protein
MTPNPSIERTATSKPVSAAHVKRYCDVGNEYSRLNEEISCFAPACPRQGQSVSETIRPSSRFAGNRSSPPTVVSLRIIGVGVVRPRGTACDIGAYEKEFHLQL